MIPHWLTTISYISIALGILSTIIITIDIVNRPPKMKIMSWVWPLTALSGSVFLVWFYFKYGRACKKSNNTSETKQKSMPVAVAKGALHCGAGCSLGDLIGENLAFFIPAVLVPFGYPDLFKNEIFAVWGLDFLIAFSFGIIFQYFAIVPMRNLKMGEGIREAIKADTLSLISWQIGMYGFMGFANFYLFNQVFKLPMETDTMAFWFMMQIAMISGFITAYPTNWWLIKKGIKEKM